MSAARTLKNSPAAEFVRLLAGGFYPIGIYPRGHRYKVSGRDKVAEGKEPYGYAWGAERWSLDRWNEAARKLAGSGAGIGVGICLGPGRGPGGSWLIDIEGDGPVAEASLAKLLGGEIIETMGWTSTRGRHRLFVADVPRLLAIMPGLKPLEGKGDRAGVYKSDELPELELRIGGVKADGATKQFHSACAPTLGTDGTPRAWFGPAAPAAMPDTFYAALAGLVVEAPPKPATAPPPRERSRTGRPSVEARAVLYLGKCDPAVSGNRGHDKTFGVACRVGPGFDLPPDVAKRLIAEHYNPRCDPPWTDAELQHKVDDAYKGETRARGWLRDEDRSPPGPRPGPGFGGVNEDADDPREPRPNEASDDPHRLARVYLNAAHRHPDRTTLVYHNGDFQRWDTAYRPVPIQAIRAALTTTAKVEFDRINLRAVAVWEADPKEEKGKDGKGKKPAVAKVTTALTNNVVQALSGETLLDDRLAAPCWLDGDGRWPAAELLPTRNALLHLPSFADGIEPHRMPPTPRFFCPYATDYDFDDSAPPPAHWLAFLGQLWPDDPDAIAALQEWFGYHLTPDTSQEKIGMLIGPKRSGKGTIAKVLTAMIGEANVTNPKFGALGSQFGVESLIGKMAAIITDARITGRTDIAQVVENLLTISGTDRQTIARKHKTDWSGNLPTKFTIISNELPRLADASGALPGRMIIFQLKESFYAKEDTSLFSRKIRPELPGILLWAVEGWKRLRERGRLVQPASGQQLVQEMEELSSPIGVFLHERCIVGPGHEVMTHELYEAWSAWCESKGKKNHGDEADLGRNLRSVMPHLKTKSCRFGNGWGRKYAGIELANPTNRCPF